MTDCPILPVDAMKRSAPPRARISGGTWLTARALIALCCLAAFVLLPAQMAGAETQGEAIVAAAASQAGVPYCEPGGSLNGPTGCGGKPATFDCSGLAMYAVYQGTGGQVALPHGAGMDHVAGGVPVARANLQPGDLVFFGPGFNGADFHHVGIYAGNGMMWDANTAFWIYGDGVRERSLAAIETELGFDGAVRYWSGSAGGGGGIGEGSYVQVSGHGEVFKIVGGAPLYVSNWNAVGGPQAVTTISQQQFESLRPYPADGTLVSTTNDGRVYEIAGGAPLYVSSWSAIGGARPAIAIDGWDVANPGNPAAHLRQYPADGTLINTTNDGRVYEIAGGAPLYVSSWSAIGGSRPSVGIDGWDVANVGNPYAHLRPYPADGTFLNTSAGRVYRVAGGAPIAVSNWSVFDGVQPYTTVDQWDVDNDSNPYAHLRPVPLDGTEVEGLPSHSDWLFGGGLRSSLPTAAGAVAVDDAGLAAFPVRTSAAGVFPSAPTGSRSPGASGVSAAGKSGGKKRRSCHRIRNRRKRPRCASTPRHRRNRKAHHRARRNRRSRAASCRPVVGASARPTGRPATASSRWRLPDYRIRGPKGAEPLARVADLHHVARRIACRVARKIIEYPWPESDWDQLNLACRNSPARVHRFDGWNVKVSDHGLPRLSRGGAWLSFQGEDFPVGC